MQIREIGLYSHYGELRTVPLRRGALNAISGPSRTGKTEIVKIIDFCCGRDKPQLAPGPITSKVAWFAVVFEGSDGRRVLVARPQPTGKSTSQAMLAFGADLSLPAAKDLVANADSSTARGALNDLIGLRDYDPEQYDGARERLRASVGHAVQFCLQNQNELSSPSHLFHRGSDADVARDFRELFPFFLGADTPEALLRRRRAADLRRQIRAAEQRLAAAQTDVTRGTVRDEALLQQAIAAGFTQPESPTIDARKQLQQLLLEPAALEPVVTANESSAAALRQQASVLREQLRLLQERRAALANLRTDSTDHTHEVEVQIGRLGIVEFFDVDHDTEDANSCPACGAALDAPDEDLAALASDARVLASQLGNMQSTGQELRAAERELDGLVAEARQRYERARAALDEAQRINDAALALATQGESRAFIRGVISEHLRQISSYSTDAVAELTETIGRLNAQLEAATAGASPSDVTEETEVRLEAIAEEMTEWSRNLELEGADSGLVRIERRTLNVAVSTRAGRVDLSAMGSGANHVGYHLVAHLALHRHFVLQNRPVPRFIMFDQPSLPYFPRNVVDKDAAQHDVDWLAVRAMFILVNEVVEGLSGQLQVLMTDHASFAGEAWFDAALVEDWHDGGKLVPPEWPDRQQI